MTVWRSNCRPESRTCHCGAREPAPLNVTERNVVLTGVAAFAGIARLTQCVKMGCVFLTASRSATKESVEMMAAKVLAATAAWGNCVMRASVKALVHLPATTRSAVRTAADLCVARAPRAWYARPSLFARWSSTKTTSLLWRRSKRSHSPVVPAVALPALFLRVRQ